MPTRRLAHAAALLALLTLAPAAGLADVIRLVPGSKIEAPGGQLSGNITAETPTEVTIKPKTGADRKIPIDQIEEVEYSGLTPSFTLAESKENAGSPEEAAGLYQKAAAEASDKPLVARAAQFGRARVLTDLALADPSRVEEALAALDAFLKAHANSRQVGPALEAVVKLSLQKGDTDRADAALADLTGRVPAFAEHAAVLQARVTSRKGNHDEAISALDRIITAAPKDSAQVREARLAKAESLVAASRFPEAETVVREVIGAAPPEDAGIQAEAHNVLGDCLRAAGRPKDALIAYLKTDVLYSSDKSQHPRALAMIVQTWTDLRQEGRAAEALERLREQYPKSPYAQGVSVAPR